MTKIKNSILCVVFIFFIVYMCTAIAVSLVYINGETISDEAFMKTNSMLTQATIATLLVFGGGALLTRKLFCK